MEKTSLPKYIAANDRYCCKDEASRRVVTRVQFGKYQKLVREEDDKIAQSDRDAESTIRVQGAEMEVDVSEDEEKRAPQHFIYALEQKRMHVRFSHRLSVRVHATADDDKLRRNPGYDTEGKVATRIPEEYQV